jgi:hypothetical protein
MRVLTLSAFVLAFSIASIGQQLSHRLNNQDVIDMLSEVCPAGTSSKKSTHIGIGSRCNGQSLTIAMRSR